MRTTGLLVLSLVATGAFGSAFARAAGAPPGATSNERTATEASARPVAATRYLGIATYYGTAYHGQVMANGELYNMHDASVAASNQWPLGTQLIVRRSAGGPWDSTLSASERDRYYGAEVLVTVKDRGEFRHELDLSYAAFSLLGRQDEGVIRVTIEPVTTGARPGGAYLTAVRP